MAETIRYLTDEKNYISFFREAVQNKFASNREGRPCFDDVLYGRVTVPGEKETAVTIEVERVPYPGGADTPPRRNETAYKRFGKEIDQFKNSTSHVPVTGMPIEQWPLITASQVQNCKILGIHTVEALENLSDTGIGKLGPGGRDLVRKAKDWLKSAAGQADNLAMREENRQLKGEVSDLRDQVAALAASVEAALDPENKKKVQRELSNRNGKAKGAGATA